MLTSLKAFLFPPAPVGGSGVMRIPVGDPATFAALLAESGGSTIVPSSSVGSDAASAPAVTIASDEVQSLAQPASDEGTPPVAEKTAANARLVAANSPEKQVAPKPASPVETLSSEPATVLDDAVTDESDDMSDEVAEDPPVNQALVPPPPPAMTPSVPVQPPPPSADMASGTPDGSSKAQSAMLAADTGDTTAARHARQGVASDAKSNGELAGVPFQVMPSVAAASDERAPTPADDAKTTVAARLLRQDDASPEGEFAGTVARHASDQVTIRPQDRAGMTSAAPATPDGAGNPTTKAGGTERATLQESTFPEPPDLEIPGSPDDFMQPGGAEAPQAASIAPTTIDIVRPVRFEALSLLQIVRDQLTGRIPVTAGDPAADRMAPAISSTKKNVDATAAIMPMDAARPDSTAIGPTFASANPAPVQQAPAPLPVVDLSASLGAQVVDMGVSGQWIDGLARDIAGLSANGAQGRFQINATALGPVQVDIRQGMDGAAVSLTVTTQAAETALRDDSDRLRLDAGLSAVRITDVKIERAPHVADAARAENTNQQSPHPHSSPQQGMGQGMGQPSGQGRWQARENFAGDHKAGGEPVVLNHADARGSAAEGARPDAGRARYA